jgi:choline-glycine betaine transporter
MSDLKIETDIITSIASSLIERAVILVMMYVATKKDRQDNHIKKKDKQDNHLNKKEKQDNHLKKKDRQDNHLKKKDREDNHL